MKIKVVEIRDRRTCIPALAIKVEAESDVQRYYFHRCGYSGDGSNPGNIILMKLVDGRATNDIYSWPEVNDNSRTMPVAHSYIEDHFNELSDGDVIDVQLILRETEKKEASERFAAL